LTVKHDPAVYPGEYITCVHDHAKALCERARVRGGEGLPDHGGCKPLACRNVGTAGAGTITTDSARAPRRGSAVPYRLAPDYGAALRRSTALCWQLWLVAVRGPAQ
jgi:hypothetical protein